LTDSESLLNYRK